LSAALGAGFRESGAVSLTASKGSGEPNPMVAIRSTGYSFDSIIGYQDDHGHNIALVHDTYLRILIGIANERFKVNEQRISRLKEGLLTRCNPPKNPASKPEWEDPEVRRRRKREEGLAKKKQLAEKSLSGREATSVEDIDDLATVGSFPEA
jgi:tRNA wybutosine-synthesizing protein 3